MTTSKSIRLTAKFNVDVVVATTKASDPTREILPYLTAEVNQILVTSPSILTHDNPIHPTIEQSTFQALNTFQSSQ